MRHDLDLKGKDVVVIGRGVTVGRSIGALMTRRAINATVTLTHTGTTDLPHLRRADVIVAAGVAHLVRPEDVKPGAIVLDVGVSPGGPRGGRRKLVATWTRPSPRSPRGSAPTPAASAP